MTLLGGDRAVHALDDEVGGLVPAQVAQHHLAREDHRARVDLVLVGVLRRGAVRRLEDGVAGDVVDVAARRDADAADLRGQRVGQVVAVQVRRRDDVELVGPRQHLLQRDVGDGVLDHDAGARLAVGNAAPRPAVDLDRAVELLRDLVAPVAEGAFGELHDVALVHQRHALALVLHGVADRAVDQALGAEPADRLEADADLDATSRCGAPIAFEHASASSRAAASVPNRIFLKSLGNSLAKKSSTFLRLGRAGGVFDAGVDVFRVLAEDHHVDLLRMLHRRRHALEPAHRAQADVEVEHLAQRDVQRADAAADRRRQRPLDADVVRAERLDGLVGQPVVELLEAFSPA